MYTAVRRLTHRSGTVRLTVIEPNYAILQGMPHPHYMADLWQPSIFFFLTENFTTVMEAKVEGIAAWLVYYTHKMVTRTPNGMTKDRGSHLNHDGPSQMT